MKLEYKICVYIAVILTVLGCTYINKDYKEPHGCTIGYQVHGCDEVGNPIKPK